MTRTLERVADYRSFGVPHIWIIDPDRQQGYNCQPDCLRCETALQVGGSPIHLDLPALFADLD